MPPLSRLRSIAALACAACACAPAPDPAGTIAPDAAAAAAEERVPDAAPAITRDGAAPAPPPTVYVSLTFDDGWADQWHAVHDLLGDAGLRATLFVNSGYIGRDGRLDWAQLHALAAAGHEIGGHTAGHRDLALLSPAGQLAQVCNDRDQLVREGFAPRAFAFPYGHHDARSVDAARTCGYAVARVTTGLGCGPACDDAESLPPADRYRVRAHPSIDGDDLATVTGWIEAARDRGGWVPLVFHHIGAPCDVGYCWDTDRLAALVDWLVRPEQRAYVRVVPVGELVPPTAAVAPADAPMITNGAMDRADRHGGTDCVQRLPNQPAAGTTYTRAVDPDGAREVIDTAAYLRPHTLLVSRDTGACAPFVDPGHRYHLSAAYRTTADLSAVALVVYGRGSDGWRELARVPAGAGRGDDTWRPLALTVAITDSDLTNLSFGVELRATGRLEADDFAAQRAF